MRSRTSFYFSEALRSLSTNKATSLAAVIAMLVALLIVGITAVGFLKARAEGERIQKDAGIVNLYLSDNVTENEVNALTLELNDHPNVESVEFVSKSDALKRAKELFKDSPGVMDNLPGNPFPASLDAKLKDPTRMEELATAMKGQPGIDEINTGGERSEKVINAIQIGTAIFFAIGLGILIAATVLVANTIRLSIYSRRREIEVMKLVGASNGFVRMPFVIEGFLCGVFAAVLAMVAVFASVKVLSSKLEGLFTSQTLVSNGSDVPLGLIALGLLGLGVVLGMLGSATSMRKYLRT